MASAFPLPANLPEPRDDGACRHLVGMPLPDISLRSTAGRMVDLGHLTAPRTVFYCYPMTGVPGQALPEGWDTIPGARGCTPQTCAFRDHFSEFSNCGVDVFAVSTQTTEYQQEMALRLQLPFEVLSDAEFKFSDLLRLPTFEVAGMRLLKRMTLVVARGFIQTVFYPVFPPDKNAEQAIAWLRENPY
jgi:peroxiredoxin